jgi:AAA ATPase domain
MSQIPLQSLFVGREGEQRRYQEFLDGSSAWILVITGQGGNGKTALLRRFAEQTPSDTAVVMLNFTNGLLVEDPLNILEKFVEQLAPHCDTQQVQVFEKVLQEGHDVLAANKQMNEIIIAQEHATVTGTTQAMSAASREQRRNINEKVRKACYNLLDSLRPLRLVVMLDTCERLNELEGQELSEIGLWVMNELVPGIQARLQQKHRRCLVVIAGRIQPHFEAIDEQEDIQHLYLPMLDQPAVEQYLQRLGMEDAALRNHIYHITHGHALCVAIIGSLWQERGEQPFTIADLPVLQEQFNQRALLKFIGERVLDKRLKSPYRDLTRYGVLLRSFDLQFLQAIFPTLLSGENALDRWHHLIRYPYIEFLRNSRYAFHDLLREIQAEEIRVQETQKWLDYHKRALDYLTRISPDSPERYYHALACDETQGLSDWWNAVEEAQLRGRREYFDALLQAVHDKTLRLSARANAQITYWEGIFYYYGGQMQAALDSYEQALTLFRQVGDRLGEANVRKAMGDVQQFRDDREAALGASRK